MKKIAMLCTPGLHTFAEPVSRDLSKVFDVRLVATADSNKIIEHCKWADVIWLEFANEMAVSVLNANIADGKQVVVRLHSYEALAGMHHSIRWDKVSQLLFVSSNIQDIVMPDGRIMVSWKQQPDNFVTVPHQIIPNGLDLDAFKFSKRGPGRNIAFVANMSSKKGIMLMIHAFHALMTTAEYDSYTLHLAGRVDEPRFGMYLSSMVEKLGLVERVIFHGFVQDIKTWLEPMNYILCTSPIESQGMGIMEAMAMGIKPVIHDFVGADQIYDSRYLWKSIPEFVEMVESPSYDSASYRQFVSDRYNIRDTSKRVRSMIHNLPKPQEYNVFDYWSKRENPTAADMPQKLTNLHINYISENIMPIKGASVFELGPGLGRTFPAYKDHEIKRLACVDVTDRYWPTALEAAKEHAGIEPDTLIRILPDDSFTLGSFKDKEFDIAVASEVLLHQRPEHIMRIMKELIRIARKVIVISWMDNHVPYIKPGDKVTGSNHCFHYHYPQICIQEKWNISKIQYANKQIFFCYDDMEI